MPAFRPLPARPNLEYARREAKALRAGDAEAAVNAAIALAANRRRDVEGNDLLHAPTRDQHGPVTELLARYGASAAMVNAALGKGL